MKVAFFKQRVDNFRASQKSFKNKQYANKSIVKVKIMGRASALLY